MQNYNVNSLTLKSVLNFRDAGGLRTCDGRLMKRGIIFRSASTDRISRKDIKKLHELGIKTIFDLRAPAEYKKRKVKIPGINTMSFPLDFEHVTRERLKPLIVAGNQEDAVQKVIIELYLEILDSAKPVLREIVQTFMSDTDMPILIHCRAGKDRTGIICALLQMIAGCEREEIIENFMKSNDYLLPVFRRNLKFRKFITLGFFPADAILDAITLRGENIVMVMDRVDGFYGGIRNYLSLSGFDMRYYEALRVRLVD